MKPTRVLSVFAIGLLAAGVAAAAEIKVGVFDFQRVSEETARGQELRAELKKFSDKKEGELTAKRTELKTLEDQYKAQAFSLAPDKRAQMEKEIQKKQLDLQSFGESANKELQIEVNQAQSKFNDELLRIIQGLGRERGYTMIFAREQLAFVSDTVDITSEVIERFNQEVAKAGAAAPAKPEAPPVPSGGAKP